MSKTQSTVIKKEKFRATRPLDYIYDPLFVVSGERDYNRMIMKQIVSNSQYSIRPIYESMFSDMLRYPRAALVLRTSEQLPANFDITYKGRLRSLAGHPSPMTDIDGSDRFKFYRRPVTFQSPEAGTLRYPLVALDNITKYAMFSTPDDICFDQEIKKLEAVEQPDKPATLTKCIQTDYREAETQTTPWAPPYSVAGRKTPEVLSLACLSWGHGLPAGMHEIEIIERLRMKRAWEKEIDTAENMEKRRKIIAEIENSDWAFREQEIQAIHDLRIAVAKQLLDQHRNKCKEKLDGRVKRVAERKNKEKDEKLKSIQHKKERALRKLTMKHKGYDPKYHKWNVTEEHLDRTSQIFAPFKRLGTEFRNRHEVLHSSNEFLKTYKDLTALENFQTQVPIFDYEKASKPKKKGELCCRETRWTEETLAKLHKDLQEITAEAKKPTTYGTLPLKIVQKPTKPKEIVLVEKEISDKDDQIYNASVLFQKIIHGRATQLQMFNEYKKLKHLVEELATTHTLKSDNQSKINENLENIMTARQLELLDRKNEAAVNSMLGDTQSKTTGMMLDFLAKELKRLKAERNAHALALLAERARYGREAAESGRRQKELQRLKEHDEMFKQVVKIHQETVDMYLEDIVIQAMDIEASEEARSHVQQLAKNIDHAAQEAQSRSFDLEKEELVADLVFNFALPEANKQIVRTKMKQRQQKYLRLAHDIIYNRKGEEIDEGAVKLTKHMVSEISKVSSREHVSPLHWENIKQDSTEPERMSEFDWSKEGRMRVHMMEDAKILVDTLIEEGIKKIGVSFKDEDLENTSQEVSQTIAQTDEAPESNENETLLYPYEIRNLVKEILTQVMKKAIDIAEWKKEVWSITSDISCLECLQIGPFEGVEFQGRPYEEIPVEKAQCKDECNSITKLLPMLEVAYCVQSAKIVSASSDVQGLQEVVSEDIATLCIDAENTLLPLDSESGKQSCTISEDEATIFMEDLEFEERLLRSTTSDPSCLECLHIAASKLEDLVSQTLSVQSHTGTGEGVKVLHSHETATSENADTDDDDDDNSYDD